MDKQRKNIRLIDEHTLKLKTGRTVNAINPIVRLYKNQSGIDCIEFRVNKVNGVYKYLAKIELADYLRYSLYNFNVKFNSSNLASGSLVYDDGFSQRAITSNYYSGSVRKVAMMHNGNRLDIRRQNVYFTDNEKISGVR